MGQWKSPLMYGWSMNKFHYFVKLRKFMINMPTLLKNMPRTQTWVNISFPTKSIKSIWRHWRIIKDIVPQMRSIKIFCVRVQTRPQKGGVFNAEDFIKWQLFSYALPYLSFSKKQVKTGFTNYLPRFSQFFIRKNNTNVLNFIRSS